MERTEDANGARHARYPTPGDTLRSDGPYLRVRNTCRRFPSFTDAVVEILQHLAQQEQGELAWVRRVRERAVAALDAEVQLQEQTEIE